LQAVASSELCRVVTPPRKGRAGRAWQLRVKAAVRATDSGAAWNRSGVQETASIDKVRALQRALYVAAKRDRKRRFHALYDRIARPDVLRRAWEQVRRNKGAAGIDGETLKAIEAKGVEPMLAELREVLLRGRYRPQAVRRVYIPKPGRPKERRPLGIPRVRDRVVQTAAKLMLEPIFESSFLPCSYGFRPKRSAHQALECIRKEVNGPARTNGKSRSPLLAVAADLLAEVV
jgi:retron-type reverse transcriptase